jgi:DNA-directed RNA polymerase specialized sigma24 family protein
VAVTLVPKKSEVASALTVPARRVKKAARRALQRSRTGLVGFDASSGQLH